MTDFASRYLIESKIDSNVYFNLLVETEKNSSDSLIYLSSIREIFLSVKKILDISRKFW